MEQQVLPSPDDLYSFDSGTIGINDETLQEISVELIPCSTCNRTFAAKALQKHARICEKAANKKRKIFDSQRQRREGTELASYPLPKGYGLPPIKQRDRSHSPKPTHQTPPASISPKKPPPEILVKNQMRSSVRKESHAKPSPLSAAPSTSSITKERPRVSVAKRAQPLASDQCPYCGRNFGIKAYDRHVEWCKEKSLITSMKNSSSNSRAAAKERLEARTKYRAPSLKSKRSINRDKYSGVCDAIDDDIESQCYEPTKANILSSMNSSIISDSVLKSSHRNLKLSKSCVLQSQNHNVMDTSAIARSESSLSGRNSNRRSRTREIVVDNDEVYHVIQKMKYHHANDIDNDDEVYDYDEEYIEEAQNSDCEEDDSYEDPRGQEEYQRRNNEQLTSRLPTSTTSLSAVQRKSKVKHRNVEMMQHHDSNNIPNSSALNSSMSMPAIVQSIYVPTSSSSSLTKLENQRMKKKNRTSTPVKAVQAAPLIKERIEFFSGGSMKSAGGSDDGNNSNSRRGARGGRRSEQRNNEDELFTPIQLRRNKSFIVSGLSDKYDPFLSAKRQLEELCSPTTPENSFPSPFQTSTPTNSNNSYSKCILSPITSPLKMTTSLTGTSTLSTSPNPRRALTTVKSNFRRTNSLRTTHRPSLLSTRPLFIPPYKQRPTIQRGLSDEGPISSSFLKPEEYDEMPVRSVCVNDFAITNSPRIIRRDTSALNRKNNMRIHVDGCSSTTGRQKSSTNSSQQNSTSSCSKDHKREHSPIGSKFLSKTDSLAAFLKYENEVANSVCNSTGNTNVNSPVTAKELKDKSNNLSKRNSAKNIQNESCEEKKSLSDIPLPAFQTQSSTTSSSYYENSASKLHSIRLEPLSKPTSSLSTQTNFPIDDIKNNNNNSKQFLSSNNHNNSSISEFIDPKLINICDNLPMNIAVDSSSKNSDDTDSSIEYSSPEKNHPSSENDSESKTTNIKSNSNIISGSNNHRNSLTDSRSFLKRKMRLGRNQFLYDDASPDADCFSADDEANRSSMEYDDQLLINSQNRYKNSTIDLPSILPSIPPIPIFDDFDFEEFLSTFENDDEQFPLFKDCKEFLMNRTSSNKFRTSSANVTTKKFSIQNNNTSANTTTNLPISKQTHSSQLFSSSQFHNNFIPLTSSSALLRSTTVNDSSASSSIRNANDFEHEDKKREIFISIETDQNDLVVDGERRDRDSCRGGVGSSSSISGHMIMDNETLRTGGNPQVHLEDIDPNDNKFSKIIIDENHRNVIDDGVSVGGGDNRETNSSSTCSTAAANNNFPNVKLNNAKNLVKKIHDDFRQLENTNEENDSSATQMIHDSNTIIGGGVGGCGKAKHRDQHKTGGNVDSDEMSSLECYPISTLSRRGGGGGGGGDGDCGDGVMTKTSADSAYGSLSRQRSAELMSQRHRNRPSTGNSSAATLIDIQSMEYQKQRQQQQQQQNQSNMKYSTAQNDLKNYRSLQFSGSSSGSEQSFPPINNRQTPQNSHNNNRNTLNNRHHHHNHHQRSSNANSTQSPLSSPSANTKTTAATHQAPSRTLSNLSSTGSTKLSRFCHECGSKFLIEQAKFCMECGVKRIAL